VSNRENLNRIIARQLARALDKNVIVIITLRNGDVVRGKITPGTTRGGALLDVMVERRTKRALRVRVDDIKHLTIPNL
jgi:hypothetical protein